MCRARTSFLRLSATDGSLKNERIYSWQMCGRLCCQNNNIFIEFVMPARRENAEQQPAKREKRFDEIRTHQNNINIHLQIII